VQLTVDEANRYAQQEILKSDNLSHVALRSGSGKMLRVEEVHVVMTLFMLMGTVQKSTLRPYYSKNELPFTVIVSEA
jgi:hypothetical protein